MCQNKEQRERNNNFLNGHVRCVSYFVLCLPTDTAVPLSHAEDGLLRGENCTGQLNIQRGVVAVVRKECQDCDRLWEWYRFIGTEHFRTNITNIIFDTQSNVWKNHDWNHEITEGCAHIWDPISVYKWVY